MTPSFLELKTKIIELNSQIQELTSSVYVMHQHDDVYEFVSYYDMQAHSMQFTILSVGMEVKLFDSIPTDIVLAYSDFIRLVQQYERGEIDFPFTLQNPDDVDDTDKPDLSVLKVDM